MKGLSHKRWGELVIGDVTTRPQPPHTFFLLRITIEFFVKPKFSKFQHACDIIRGLSSESGIYALTEVDPKKKKEQVKLLGGCRGMNSVAMVTRHWVVAPTSSAHY